MLSFAGRVFLGLLSMFADRSTSRTALDEEIVSRFGDDVRLLSSNVKDNRTGRWFHEYVKILVYSVRSLNDWLTESGVYYSLSTLQRRPGTPLARDSGLELDSWDALDRPSGVLGESTLHLRDLDWFFEYHDRSAHRVSNVMRRAVRLWARISKAA